MVEASKERISISKDLFEELALEVWRLWATLERNKLEDMHYRYPIKKMKESLESAGCTFIDVTGQAYDAGMAIDVLDTEDDPTMVSGAVIVKEMVTPIIIWKQEVIHHGQVILRKGMLANEQGEVEGP